MRTVAYCRQQAAECQRLAKLMSFNEYRERLLQMAQEWVSQAAEREAQLRKGSAPSLP